MNQELKEYIEAVARLNETIDYGDKFSFCSTYYDAKNNDKLAPNQKKYDYQPKGNEDALGLGVPEGFILYDFDLPPNEKFRKYYKKTWGHTGTKPEGCGHLLFRCKDLHSSMTSAKLKIFGSDVDLCRKGYRPVFTPGSCKIKGGGITHHWNKIEEVLDEPEEFREARMAASNSTPSYSKPSTSKKGIKRDPVIKEGGRHFFMAVQIGRWLLDNLINKKQREEYMTFANKKYVEPMLSDEDMQSIFKQMDKEAKERELVCNKILMEANIGEGDPTKIRESLKALGWEFRRVRGDTFEYKKPGKEWEALDITHASQFASNALSDDVRYTIGIKIETKKAEKTDKEDHKLAFPITHFKPADLKVKSTILEVAHNNRYDYFEEYLKPFEEKAKKQAEKYGIGNWKDTLEDLKIWKFKEKICQRTPPPGMKSIGFGEQPYEYWQWQYPIIMLSAIWRTKHPGYEVEEMIWNMGPQGCYKNKGRSWLFPGDIRKKCYASGLKLTPHNEAKMNRIRRKMVISEFDEAEKISIDDMKRYFTTSVTEHEAKYEEDTREIQWQDVIVFSTNKPNAFPPTLDDQRRLIVQTSYPKPEFTEMIQKGEIDGKKIKKGMSKKTLDEKIEGVVFKQLRDELWMDALTLYYMEIPPCLPGELETERIKAMVTATGADQLEPIIMNAFIEAHKRDNNRYVLSSELAELCEKPANQIGVLANKIHKSLGGSGSKAIYKEGNRKGYKCEDIIIPPNKDG